MVADEDVVDGPGGEGEEDPDEPLCKYVILDSCDPLKINLTPTAMDLLIELTQVSLILLLSLGMYNRPMYVALGKCFC